MPAPVHCRPEAYHLFARFLADVDTSTDALVGAAVAISMHELDDADPVKVNRQLQEFIDQVRARTRSRHAEALLAHLHGVLFDEAGFVGNSEDYYNPLNSYLPAVLESRRGIPITLALIYKVVAERVGLEVDGVDAPGHFLVRVRDEEGAMLVDPFSGGRVMTLEEALKRIEEVSGRPVPREQRRLPLATHRRWLARMLTNLQNAFVMQGRREAFAAMGEMKSLIE